MRTKGSLAIFLRRLTACGTTPKKSNSGPILSPASRSRFPNTIQTKCGCGCRLSKPQASSAAIISPQLNSHWHQNVQGAFRILVLDQGRRSWVGQLQHGGLTFDLRRDVQQVAGIEADIERIGSVLDLNFLSGAARIRIGHRKHQSSIAERQFYGASAFTRYR